MNYTAYVKYLIAIATILLSCPAVKSQQTAQKFVQETQYLLYLPEDYNTDTAARWPLLMFLHGSGERGIDLEKVKAHGPPKLIGEGKKFPFIVVSPQALPDHGWDPENLYQLLLSVKARYRVDNERVFLTGLSMGGFGTWALAMKHPQEFAAIVPICGGGDTTDTWKLRNIPIWCFHGALDDVVPLERDQSMVTAAQKYNPSVRFTVYPDAHHNSWERTYNNDTLYQWLLAQKKFAYKQVNVAASIMKGYAGRYTSSQKDTVQILVENDTLKAKTSTQSFALKGASDRLFFIDEKIPVDIRFIPDATGKFDSFLLMEDNRYVYRKL